MSDRELSRTLLRTPVRSDSEYGLLNAAFGIAGLALLPPYLAASGLVGTPGLALRLRCGVLALRQLFVRRNRLATAQLFRLLAFPMDSVRYFEYDFAWRSLSDLDFRT